MNILAIDSSTKKATVALKANDTLIDRSIDNEITHSEKLLPLISSTLTEANLNLKDIDLLACTLGPGSFTGVRIGIATIKAMAKVINKKIYGITTLNVFALDAAKSNKISNKYVLSLIDARNSRVYFELYKYIDSKLKPVNESGNMPIEALISLLKNNNVDDLFVTGDVAEAYSQLFAYNFNNIIVKNSNLNIDVIFTNITEENIYDYLTLDAMYYRSSEAERTKFGENNG